MSSAPIATSVRQSVRQSVRLWIRPWRYRARQATAKSRVLPDFIIAGAQKAGTTSLYAYLCAHPQVFAAGRKEVHFFDLNYDQGPSWYRSMFPLAYSLKRAQRAGRSAVTGEASPYYLFHPLAAERAAALVPKAKIIILLRDPIERAWSHYRHEVKAGRESLSFGAALSAEPERLSGTADLLRTGGPGATNAAHRYESYVARGRYAEQLSRWMAQYPSEQMLVLRAEDLFTEPARVWAETLHFLGLPAVDPPAFDVHNQGATSQVPDAERAVLTELYRDPNEALAALLGDAFRW